jgi:hypothetical protein
LAGGAADHAGLAQCQTKGLIGFVIGRLGLDLAVPAQSALSRRTKALEVPPLRRLGTTGRLHLLVDSTGLKLSGAGEWLVEKHGPSRRRVLAQTAYRLRGRQRRDRRCRGDEQRYRRCSDGWGARARGMSVSLKQAGSGVSCPPPFVPRLRATLSPARFQVGTLLIAIEASNQPSIEAVRAALKV